MIGHAIVMAGGEGRRLRPLTENCPKPLIPMLDEPVIGMTLRLLRRHGIKEATLTLCYRAEHIIHALGDGSAYGVKVRYAVEKEPRGTAGSVKDAAQGWKETMLVLSGDGITDADLTEMYQQHIRSGAQASMMVKRVDEPSAYGVCEVNANGNIVTFCEKPANAPEGSLVNTGIYFLEPTVLEKIPDEGMYDFGRDLLPALLVEGVRIHAIETDAYWCDIGSREAYAKAQKDLLCGRVGLPVRGQRVGHAIIGKGCTFAPDVRIAGRCYIGDHACIGRGAVLGAGTVIHSGAIVGSSARLEQACLWHNARVEGDSIIKGVVVMPHAGNAGLQRIIPFEQ